MVDEILAPRRLSVFLLLREAIGDPGPLLTGGGCESRSKSADEAASLAERELASLGPSPALLEPDAASVVVSLACADAFVEPDGLCEVDA